MRLFIDAQNQGMVWRVEVQPDNVAHLVDKPRIAGQFKGFQAVRLQAKGAAPIHCLLPPIDQTAERYRGSQAK
jgi:hypothetical protein